MLDHLLLRSNSSETDGSCVSNLHHPDLFFCLSRSTSVLRKRSNIFPITFAGLKLLPFLSTMAANEYYNGSQRHDRPPQPPPLNKPPGLDVPSPYPAYGGPYDPRTSQYTLGSEQDYSSTGVGVRPHDADQYAEDIPLKANAAHNGRQDYDYDTHYPPSPENQRIPLGGPANYSSRSKARRFFKGKIPWAVYVITAVQIAVFIAEIARNGRSSFFSFSFPFFPVFR